MSCLPVYLPLRSTTNGLTPMIPVLKTSTLLDNDSDGKMLELDELVL